MYTHPDMFLGLCRLVCPLDQTAWPVTTDRCRLCRRSLNTLHLSDIVSTAGGELRNANCMASMIVQQLGRSVPYLGNYDSVLKVISQRDLTFVTRVDLESIFKDLDSRLAYTDIALPQDGQPSSIVHANTLKTIHLIILSMLCYQEKLMTYRAVHRDRSSHQVIDPERWICGVCDTLMVAPAVICSGCEYVKPKSPLSGELPMFTALDIGVSLGSGYEKRDTAMITLPSLIEEPDDMDAGGGGDVSAMDAGNDGVNSDMML
jgi:hypothetical protein